MNMIKNSLETLVKKEGCNAALTGAITKEGDLQIGVNGPSDLLFLLVTRILVEVQRIGKLKDKDFGEIVNKAFYVNKLMQENASEEEIFKANIDYMMTFSRAENNVDAK